MHSVTHLIRDRLGRSLSTIIVSLLIFTGVTRAAEVQDQRAFNLPADVAEKTLKQFAEQSGRGVVFLSDKVKGVRTNAVQGTFAPREALDQMVAGTPLTVSLDEKTGAFAIRRETEAPNGERAALTSDRPKSQSKGDGETMQLPAFEVMAGKVLNMDVRRSIDDAQPYVILDRAQIERSGATNIEDLLKTRLSQSTTTVTNSQNFGRGAMANSRVNLRGLGEAQTLILIDGRRSANVFTNLNNLEQPDLNGIPLAAIERIEVLPTTASGIYGGGATGGVINVILRRDYAGSEFQATYDNVFASDAPLRRLDFSAGFNSNKGATNILISGSLARQEPVQIRDRSYVSGYRDRVFRNSGSDWTLFGSPPLGATPNILSADGSALVFKNGTPLNTVRTFVATGYSRAAGPIEPVLQQNAGAYNLTLADSSQSDGGAFSLLAGSVTESLNITARHQFGPRLQTFVEIAGSKNNGFAPFSASFPIAATISSTAPTNPFRQDIVVAIPFKDEDRLSSKTTTYRAAAGLIADLGKGWRLEGDYVLSETYTKTYQRSLSSTQLYNAIASGGIDVLRDLARYPLDPATLGPYSESADVQVPRSRLRDGALRFTGPLLHVLGRTVTLSGLVEHQEAAISKGILNRGGSLLVTPDRRQSVSSAYVETRLPLITEERGRLWAQLIELHLALRGDKYTTHGVTGILSNPTAATPIVHSLNEASSSNPTVDLLWKVNHSISFRTSYGTGFVAPSVQQITPGIPANQASFLDPRRGNTTAAPAGPYQILSGGNPNLRPENSESWSVGAILTPAFLSGLRISSDFVSITKRNNISSTFPGGTQALINNEALFPNRITRGPNLASDPQGWAGPITFIDATALNLAHTEVSAWDTQLDYRHETQRRGDFSVFLSATRALHYRTQLLSTASVIENVGFAPSNSGLPTRWKANLGLTWGMRAWTLGWNTRYYSNYLIYGASATAAQRAQLLRLQSGDSVSGQVYHDLFVRYKLSRVPMQKSQRSRWLEGMTLTLGVKNIFGREPSFDASAGLPYSSPLGDYRGAAYYVTIKTEL